MFLIFEYVVENTCLKKKKSYQILYRQTEHFLEIELQEGTSICTESL